MNGPPAQQLDWMAAGTAFFAAALDCLDDAELGAASLLPGWSRAQVTAHVARNAEALGNLLCWAVTGVETPMYASREHRAAEIERSAAQPAAALRRDFVETAARLAAQAANLPPPAWQAPVRTAAGRAITAAEVPWLRVRELWVHAVDLSSGASFGQLPQPLLAALVGEVAGAVGAGPDCPAVELLAGERRWRIGQPGPAVTVRGTLADLLGWLTGREPGGRLESAAPLPQLPPWL